MYYRNKWLLWKDLVVNGAHGWWCPLRQHITYIFISPPSLFTTLTSPDNVVSCDCPWLKPTRVYNSLPCNIRSVTDFHTFFVWSAKVCFHVVHAIVREHSAILHLYLIDNLFTVSRNDCFQPMRTETHRTRNKKQDGRWKGQVCLIHCVNKSHVSFAYKGQKKEQDDWRIVFFMMYWMCKAFCKKLIIDLPLVFATTRVLWGLSQF